jgi:excisionase family DNA binding protein
VQQPRRALDWRGNDGNTAMTTREKVHPAVDPVLYSVRMAAAALCCGETKCRELIASGRLQAVQFDGEMRVTRAALEAFVQSLEHPHTRRTKLRTVRA